jgi:hypothetical protein
MLIVVMLVEDVVSGGDSSDVGYSVVVVEV